MIAHPENLRSNFPKRQYPVDRAELYGFVGHAEDDA